MKLITVKLDRTGNEFVVSFPYDAALVAAVKALPRRRWLPERKVWAVPAVSAVAPSFAAMLTEIRGAQVEIMPDAKERLDVLKAKGITAKEGSRATTANIEIPAPEGLEYLPFQRAGIAYAMQRPATLIADEMGLGKTIQAIGVINIDPALNRILILCPASLKLNWARELRKWLTRPLTIAVANGKEFPDEAQIVIINYDLLKKHAEAVRTKAWDMLVADESHYLKNPKAQRTTLTLGGKDMPAIQARKRLFLTGTPILNRPIELWPVIHALAPQEFSSWKRFVIRYCGGYQGKYGWEVGGASNLGELQELLRTTCMVRRLKKDVLTELPAKRRQVIELPANGAGGAVQEEQQAWAAVQGRIEALRIAAEIAKVNGTDEEYEAAVRALAEGSSTVFAEMARLRHATAVAKIPYVIEHLRDAVEQNGKVVCFAHHHDVIDAIAKEFGVACVTLTGETAMEARQAAIDRFQADDTCTLFVGNLRAAGVGITLTAASVVVFAELDWVPGVITQAEDRLHRIGQANSVLVQHLVLEGSLDAVLARAIVDKQTVIDAALDDEIPILRNSPIIVAPERTASRERLEKEAAQMTAEQIDAVHVALRMLAGVCDGALALDGQGFNKLDARLGHDLAESVTLTPRQAAYGARLANKYRRQLPSTLLPAMRGV